MSAVGAKAGGRAVARTVPATLVAVGALALLLGAPAARASCCIFEDPLLAIGDAAARSGHLRIALDMEALSSAAAMDVRAGIGMEETVRQTALRTVAVYSPAERLNVVAAVPLVRREWRISGGGMPEEAVFLTGVGDVDVGARLALWRRIAFVRDPERIAVTRAQALALSMGTSLPTGENGARRAGIRLDEHAQIGTGGWGPYAGLLYELQREPWAVAASGTARLRTTNGHGYRFGAAILAGFDFQREVATRLSVGIGADVRWAAPDAQSGATVANTGGFLGSATVSGSVGLAPGVRARARAMFPVVQRLEGEQRAGHAFVLGLAWNAS